MAGRSARNRDRGHDVTPRAPPWFAEVGQPLAQPARALAESMRHAIATIARQDVEYVADWRAAATILHAIDADGVWWDAEEAERAWLWERAAERLGEADVAARLAAIAGRLAEPCAVAALAAMAKAGIADPALARAAAGAAQIAAQQRELAALAGEARAHFFEFKHALFAAGRWPLGNLRGAFRVF